MHSGVSLNGQVAGTSGGADRAGAAIPVHDSIFATRRAPASALNVSYSPPRAGVKTIAALTTAHPKNPLGP